MIIDKQETGIKITSQKSIAQYIISLREDGILHLHVLNKNNGKWEPEDYKLLIPVVGEMVDYQKVPALITYDENVFPSTEAAACWADPETNCPYFSSEAFILDSLPLKILGDFYIKFKKPFRPTKIFSDEVEAVDWLKTFMDS